MGGEGQNLQDLGTQNDEDLTWSHNTQHILRKPQQMLYFLMRQGTSTEAQWRVSSPALLLCDKDAAQLKI